MVFGFERCWTIARNDHAGRPTPWRVVFCEKMLEWQRDPGFAKPPASKECYGGRRLGVERLIWLSQIIKQRARQLEICGFESFREAVVHEGERMARPIALPVFGEHACQDHRRPQLPGERRLRACDSERFGQAVQG